MPLSAIPLPSLHNGVSQQPPSVRSPDQGEAQVNGWSSLADGLQKRAPSQHVAKLLTSSASSAFVHQINRDTSERFVVIAQGGRLRVFDMNGVEQTVNAPSGWGYLAGVSDYPSEIAMSTVADYTFVVNRNKVPALKP